MTIKPKTHSNHFALWLIPIGMLFLALIELPYGYYTLLRIIVSGCCGYLAYVEFEANQKASTWVFTLGAIAILFNPLIPIHLSREIWAFIDPLVAIILIGHFVVQLRKRNSEEEITNIEEGM